MLPEVGLRVEGVDGAGVFYEVAIEGFKESHFVIVVWGEVDGVTLEELILGGVVGVEFANFCTSFYRCPVLGNNIRKGFKRVESLHQVVHSERWA